MIRGGARLYMGRTCIDSALLYSQLGKELGGKLENGWDIYDPLKEVRCKDCARPLNESYLTSTLITV